MPAEVVEENNKSKKFVGRFVKSFWRKCQRHVVTFCNSWKSLQFHEKVGSPSRMHLLCVFSFLDNGIFFNHGRNYRHARIWLQWKRRNILWIWLRRQNPAENGAVPQFLPYVKIGIKMKLPFLLAIFIILIQSHLLHLSCFPKI